MLIDSDQPDPLEWVWVHGTQTLETHWRTFRGTDYTAADNDVIDRYDITVHNRAKHTHVRFTLQENLPRILYYLGEVKHKGKTKVVKLIIFKNREDYMEDAYQPHLTRVAAQGMGQTTQLTA